MDITTGEGGVQLNPGDGFYCNICNTLNVVCENTKPEPHMHPASARDMKEFGLNKMINLSLYYNGRFN